MLLDLACASQVNSIKPQEAIRKYLCLFGYVAN